MSEENVEVVKSVFKAWEDRDPKTALERIHPEVEVDGTGTAIWGRREVERGHEALGRSVSYFLDTWESLEFETEAFIDVGDHVLVCTLGRGRGRGSGADVERRGFVIYTVRDGLVTRFRLFDSLEKAARALGI